MQTKTEKVALINKFSTIILLCGIGIVIYLNSFNSSFHFDDESSIVKNLNITNLSNLKLIWDFWPTRFITYLSLAFNYNSHQLRVFGYHFFNLAIHLTVTILAWWFILLTFATPIMRKDKIFKHANLIAFFVAAIFIAHPIQTQAVTYIIQRATSLAALFYLLTLCLYIKSRALEIEKNDSKLLSHSFYLASLATAVVGMFTKEMIITLPLAVVIYELYFLKIPAGLNWKKIFPFFGIALIIPLTMFVTKSVNFVELRRVSEYSPSMSSWTYLLTQFRVIITYFRLLFIPLNQSLDYDYPVAKMLLEPSTFFSLLFLALILIIAIRIFYRYRLVSFSIFWFFLILLPESSILPIHDVIFEHRLYLPMLGYAIFLCSGMYYLFKNRNRNRIILILITLGYAVLTYSRNFVWQDDIILCNDIIRKAPRKPRPYVHLANAYAQNKMYSQAIGCLINAIQIEPNNSDAYYNLGAIYYENGDFDKAIFYLSKAIQIDPLDFEAYYYRGVSFSSKKEYAKAIADFNLALGINSKYLNSYSGLANAYSAVNKNDEATSLFNKAIAVNPDIAQLYIYAAVFHGNIDNYQESIDLFKKAININPNSSDAYFNLGCTYGNMGNFNEAIKSFQKAIAINPSLALAHNALSIAYYNIKNYNLAIKHCDMAIQLGYPVPTEFLESLKNKAPLIPSKK